jgi:hypothetical protein
MMIIFLHNINIGAARSGHYSLSENNGLPFRRKYAKPCGVSDFTTVLDEKLMERVPLVLNRSA